MTTQQINEAQIPLIKKVIKEECKKESKSRGCRVDEQDSVIQKKVCVYIIKHGAEIRAKAIGK